MSTLLSLDLGTESARVGVFDTDGRLLAKAECGYHTAYPRPGWAEQDPRDWWQSAVSAVRTALADAGHPEVAAIACATTASTVAFLDAQGEPLRPAILWMDSRASAESARTAEVPDERLRYAGGSDAAEWLVPKAMWVARHEPEIYAEAHTICEAVDFLTFKLTGEWFGSRMNACCKWNYDPRSGVLPADLYAEFGVPELAGKLPGTILPVGTPATTVSAKAVAEFGMRGRPVVAIGGIDAHLSLLATGALSPGRLSVVAGTSSAFITEVEKPVFPTTIWGPYPDALRDGQWLIEGGQVSSGSVLRWVSETLLGLPRTEVSNLIASATDVEPESHGLCVLDHFMGNRTPLRDARLRGGVLGLTVGTSPAELYRAAVEGVGYGTRSVLESFVDAGIPVSDIYFSGGISHNRLWLQTTADVLGRPLREVRGHNLTLLACATLGAVAIGHYPDLASAVAAFAPEATLIEPDPRFADRYEQGYQRYRAASAATTAVLHDLADTAVRDER